MRYPRRVATYLLFACTLHMVSHTSFAQGTPKSASAQASSADRLFQEGTALMKEARFTEACAKLAESERLKSGIGTLLWLGECLQKSDKQASAYRTFQKAAALARTRGDNRETVASTRAARIEPTVPRWTLVPPAQGEHTALGVTLDGVTVARDQWGSPEMIDAGDYQLLFAKSGYISARRALHIESSARVVITIPELVHVAASIDAPYTDTKPTALTKEPQITPDVRAGYWTTRRFGGASLAAAGVLAIGVGLSLALGAKSVYDDTAFACSGGCVDDASFSRRQDAHDRATIATWLVAIGGTAAAAGLVITLWPSLTASKSGAALVITPAGASARLRF